MTSKYLIFKVKFQTLMRVSLNDVTLNEKILTYQIDKR
jgi:hypothetical protein